jgi:HAD superfamily hydrolase (TIGR01459 family)
VIGLLRSAAELSKACPAWLCDVWGVIHDGTQIFPETQAAMIAHRKGGGVGVLISNAPRPAASVIAQLDGLGLSREAYDSVVTSGDITVKLAGAREGESYFLVGPEVKDAHLLERLVNPRVRRAEEAQFILCTGPENDEVETAADYEERLQAWAEMDLPMICANPDRVVQRGNRLIVCAGALAERYTALGGDVVMAGKPYAPIYEAAVGEAMRLKPDLAREQIVAIGDGMVTDAEGAHAQGLALAFIRGGIHGADFANDAAAEAVLKARFPGIQLACVLAQLA